MAGRPVVLGSFVLAAGLLAGSVGAQEVTYRGFFDVRGVVFPQDAPNDRRNLVAEALARLEASIRTAPWLQVAGGLDLRGDTHDQVAHSWQADLAERGARRPRLAIRRLAATVHKGPLTVDAGKQFIRWGKTDIVTPTDRFAPRDLLNVIDGEFLGVTGARASLAFESDTIEAAWVPVFTPSRIPLLTQRWAVVPPSLSDGRLVDAGLVVPRRSQGGVRWAHTASTYEYSLAFFDGFNHLPAIEAVVTASALGRPSIAVRRSYPALRMFGGDVAMPTRWVTIKGEVGYFTSSTVGADEYVLYVVQLERQSGEWLLIGGYAGEVVTAGSTGLRFAPDRGIARSLVGRALYTIDSNRSFAVEGAVRQNGDGLYAKGEYSQARGQHWRATISGGLLRGEPSDFLGQYRRNSHASAAVRYSF